MRPLLGMDVDGVLYQFGEAARDALLAKFGGREISHEVYLAPEHMSARKWAWLWSDESAPLIFGAGRAFPGAVAAARRLHRLCDIRIISKTPANGRDARVTWLRRRGVPFEDVRFVDPGLPKSGELPHCDIYLDDSGDVVDDLATHTDALVLLLDRKWNRDDKTPRVPNHVRVFSWNDVQREVLAWQRRS